MNFRPYLALSAICIIWGTTYLAIRVGVHEFPTFLFSGLRFVVAGFILCIYYLLIGYKIPKWTDFRNLMISGISISIGGNLLLCFAEKEIPSGLAAIINCGLPFWIVLFSRIMMPEEKITTRLLTGLAVGFIGQLLIFYDQLALLADPKYLGGIILAFFAVMGGSFGSVHMKKYTTHTNPIFGGGIQMLCCGCITTTIGFLSGEKIPWHASSQVWESFIYLIIAGSLIGYSCFCYALSKLPATLVSIYTYVNPIVAIILGWFILRENITPTIIAAMLITILGIYIIKSGFRKETVIEG
jgi:drug/metabolite transporter (DMT)-like permease